MLKGEITSHLEESKASKVANRRNGSTKKTVRSFSSGHLKIVRGRYQEGAFSPKILPKRQLTLTSDLEEKVTAMQAKGISTRDIGEQPPFVRNATFQLLLFTRLDLLGKSNAFTGILLLRAAALPPHDLVRMGRYVYRVLDRGGHAIAPLHCRRSRR
jgi:hypothetical protein